MSRPQTITIFGNAQISTAQSKFGGTSIDLDGTGDYISVDSTTDFQFGTGDFTIECWIYRSTTNSQDNILDFRTANSQIAPTLYITSTNNLVYYVNGASRISGSTITTNTWHHVVVARSGTSTKMFLNGTQVGSTYTDTNDYIQSPLYIGSRWDNLSTSNFGGYIDEVRITKGLARYTANFTAPTARFENDSDTVLLIHADSFSIVDDYYHGTQTSSDQLYIEDNYLSPDGYFTYIAEAAAALSSNNSVACSVNLLKGVTAALTSSASMSCSADSGSLQIAEALLESSATISVDGTVTREFDAALTSDFAQTADAGKIVDALVDAGSLFTPGFDVNAQLAGDALLEVISSLENTISKYTGFESTLENIVNLSLQGVMTADSSSALSSSFEETADAVRFRDTEVSLTAFSSLSVDATITVDAIAIEAGEFSLSADATVLQIADATLSAEFSVAALGEEFIPKTYPNNRPKTLRFFVRVAASPNTLTYYSYDDWVASVYNNPTTSYTNSTYFNSASNYEGSYSFTFDDNTGGNQLGFESTLGTSNLVIPSTSDFIFEFAVYNSSRRASETLASAAVSVAAGQTFDSTGVTASGFKIGTSAGGNLTAYIASSTGIGVVTLSSSTNLPTDTWSRVALRRVSGTFQLVLNSTVLVSSSGNAYNLSLGTRANLYNNVVDQTDELISFDHWNLRIGESNLSDGSTIYTPANTYFRYRFENNFNDSLGGYLQLDAESLASTASITAVPNFTVDGITIHQSSGTLTADVGVIYENTASVSSEFALAADAEEVPIEFEAALASEFAVSADVYRTQEGAASIASEFTQTAEVYRTQEGVIQTDAIFSELVAVARVGAGFITAESYVNLTADVSRTVGISADITSEHTLTAVVYRTQEGSASISSEFTLSSDVVKTTDVFSTQSSEFTQTTTAINLQGFEAALASEFAVAANVSGGFIGGDAQLQTIATVSANGDRYRFADSAFDSIASINVIADRFAEMPAALAGEFNQSIDYIRYRNVDIQTDAIFSELAAVVKTGSGFVTLDSVASLAATVNVIQGQSATLDSVSTLALEPKITRNVSAAISSEFQLVGDGTTNITGDADLASEFSVYCDGDVTGVGSSALIAVASLITAVPEVIRSAESLLTSSANLSATVVVIKTTGTAVTSAATLTAELSRIKDSGVINLGALFTPSVEYRILRLDQYVYTIPSETRNYTIHRESRKHTLQRERRSYTIRG